MDELNPYQTPNTLDSQVDSASPLVPEELRRVRQGLFVIYYGIVGVVFAFVAGPVCVVLGVVTGYESFSLVIGIVMVLFMLVGALATLIGQVRCFDVPAACDARVMIVGAVSCQVLSVLLMIAIAAVKSMGGAMAGAGDFTIAFYFLTELGSTIVWVAGVILSVVFLRRLNVYIGNEKHANSARTVIGMITVASVFYLLLNALRWAQGMGFNGVNGTFLLGGLVFSMAYLVVLLLGLVTFIKYANLVLYTAKAIGRAEA